VVGIRTLCWLWLSLYVVVSQLLMALTIIPFASNGGRRGIQYSKQSLEYISLCVEQNWMLAGSMWKFKLNGSPKSQEKGKRYWMQIDFDQWSTRMESYRHRSSCFTWTVPLSQWLVFSIVHGFWHRVDTSFWSKSDGSDGGEVQTNA